MLLVVSNAATHINLDVYDLTSDQIAVFSSTDSDAVTLITKMFLLTQINAGVGAISIFSFGLTIIFIIALAKALKEVIPVLPS